MPQLPNLCSEAAFLLSFQLQISPELPTKFPALTMNWWRAALSWNVCLYAYENLSWSKLSSFIPTSFLSFCHHSLNQHTKNILSMITERWVRLGSQMAHGLERGKPTSSNEIVTVCYERNGNNCQWEPDISSRNWYLSFENELGLTQMKEQQNLTSYPIYMPMDIISNYFEDWFEGSIVYITVGFK